MNKRTLHHVWAVIRPLRTVYFLAAFLVFAIVAVVALRNNYQTMVSLRQAVFTEDAQGDGGPENSVEQALQKLRAHVNQHMNTALSTDSSVYPPIQLKNTYERLVKTEQERVNTVNSQVYTDAQHYCEAKYPQSFSGGPRVPCIEQYVKDHGTSPQPITADLYKFNFASPRWSPDLAGISLVLAAFFGVLAVLRFTLGRILRSML